MATLPTSSLDLKKVLRERMLSLLQTTSQSKESDTTVGDSSNHAIQNALSSFIDEKRKQIVSASDLASAVLLSDHQKNGSNETDPALKNDRPVAVTHPQPRLSEKDQSSSVSCPAPSSVPQSVGNACGGKSDKVVKSTPKRSSRRHDKSPKENRKRDSPRPKRKPSALNGDRSFTSKKRKRSKSRSKSPTSRHHHKERRHKNDTEDRKKHASSDDKVKSHKKRRCDPEERRKPGASSDVTSVFEDINTSELEKFVTKLVKPTSKSGKNTYSYTFKRHPSPPSRRSHAVHRRRQAEPLRTERSSSIKNHSDYQATVVEKLPSLSLPQASTSSITTGGTGKKSLKELTDFCRKIAEQDQADKVEPNNESGDKDVGELPKKKSAITLKIKDGKQLKAKSAAEQVAEQMQSLYPVSTGLDHHGSSQKKEHININPEFHRLIQRRLEAVKVLSQNPNDYTALLTIEECDAKISSWAKQEPQRPIDMSLLVQPFTSTSVPPATPAYSSQAASYVNPYTAALSLQPYGPQPAPLASVWNDPQYLQKAAQAKVDIGKKLLEKFGWKDGQGLGKDLSGMAKPVMPEVKHDRKGLHADGEFQKPTNCRAVVGGTKIVGKHPVSMLGEICAQRRWSAPLYSSVSTFGPSHRQSFVMSVNVNGTVYQATSACQTKKEAKALAALVCLQSLKVLKTSPSTSVSATPSSSSATG